MGFIWYDCPALWLLIEGEAVTCRSSGLVSCVMAGCSWNEGAAVHHIKLSDNLPFRYLFISEKLRGHARKQYIMKVLFLWSMIRYMDYTWLENAAQDRCSETWLCLSWMDMGQHTTTKPLWSVPTIWCIITAVPSRVVFISAPSDFLMLSLKVDWFGLAEFSEQWQQSISHIC